MQSSSQIVTSNKPTLNILQAGCPSRHPVTIVRALKVSICWGLNSGKFWSTSCLFDNIYLVIILEDNGEDYRSVPSCVFYYACTHMGSIQTNWG